MRTYGMSGSLGSPRSKPGTMVVLGHSVGRCPCREMPIIKIYLRNPILSAPRFFVDQRTRSPYLLRHCL